jgi:hypothetical protein
VSDGKFHGSLKPIFSQIKKENKYFQRFHGGWPIHDLIKQYLVNNLDKFKRAQRQEHAAEAEDPAVWDDDDDDDDELSDAGDEDDAANSDEEEANVPLDDGNTVEEAEENAEYERSDLDAPADLDFEADQLMDLQNIDDILVTSTPTKTKSNLKVL